jgi:hypothetical protein
MKMSNLRSGATSAATLFTVAPMTLSTPHTISRIIYQLSIAWRCNIAATGIVPPFQHSRNRPTSSTVVRGVIQAARSALPHLSQPTSHNTAKSLI